MRASSADAAGDHERPSAGSRLRSIAADLVAGLQGAVSSVPGGMATAVLAGVHPVQGLYACVAGPVAGGLLSRTRQMVMSTSGAIALAAGAMDLRIVELIPLDDGRLAEAPAPERLRSERVTVLDIYGSLLYAGSRTLQVKLPDPAAAERAVLVLRLRRRTELGATFIRVINDYAQRLVCAGGRVYLSGLDPEVIQRLDAAGLLGGRVTADPATPILGQSTYQAFLDAEQWLVSTDRED